MKIIRKKKHKSVFEGWHIVTEDETDWSVLNFKDVNKNHPMPKGVYLGWEAWNGHLNVTLRAVTEQEILDKIELYENRST